MAAVLAAGTTVIDNAAREPEIVDLCRDARRDGRPDRRRRAPRRSTIDGVDAAAPGRAHDVVPDRIVAGTWAFAAAMTARRRRSSRGASRATSTIALDKLADAGADGRAATPDGFRVHVDRAAARPSTS